LVNSKKLPPAATTKTTPSSSKDRLVPTAQAVAWLDLLVPPVNLANTADPASPALPVSPDSLAAHQRSASHPLCLPANPAHLDLLDLPVPRDHQATLARTDPQVLPAKTLRMVPPAHQDQLDLPDPQDPMVLPVTKAKMVPKSQSFPESQDSPVMLEPLVPQDPPVNPDPTELLEPQEAKVPQEPPDPMERTENPARTDPPAHPDPLERRVSAPSTAVWTEEFSSKTEPAVKLLQSADASTILSVLFLFFSCTDYSGQSRR